MKYEITKLGVPNKNGRIYPKEVMEKAINDNEQLIKNKGFMVSVYDEHSDPSNTINLTKVAAFVNDCKIENDMVVADIELLNTPMGNYIKENIDKPWSVRPVGFGKLTQNEQGQHVVSDYELLYFTFTDEGA
jgi:hypothetical protein